MKRVVKWASLTAVGLAVLLAGAYVALWATSEAVLARTWPVRSVALARATDVGAVERGAWIARTRGCTDCHGADMHGTPFFDEMPIARLWAPNVTRIAAGYNDGDLARSIRQGVRRDGRGVLIMPSATFSRLTDPETADLIAWLRSLPVGGPEQPAPFIGPLGRLGLATGRFDTEVSGVAEAARRRPPDLGSEHVWARHFVATTCSECHGPDLRGSSAVNAPDLLVAGAYSEQDFARLLRTGVAAGGRRVGLMSDIAPGRFGGLSDQQIAAIHAYLRVRADLTPPPPPAAAR